MRRPVILTAGGWLSALSGNWFHSLPSSSLPPVFGERPPHCLKKNATRAATHWFRISIAHSGFIGRARGPLSPPTITQSMPVRDLADRSDKRFYRQEADAGVRLL